MLTTVEQKLSAIKAINSEIDECDALIEVLEQYLISGVDIVSLQKEDIAPSSFLSNKAFGFRTDASVSVKICHILKESYQEKKQILFAKAQELMK